MHKPSSVAVTLFSISFLGYSMLVGFPFEEIVTNPKLLFVKSDVETRWRWFASLHQPRIVPGDIGV